VGERKTECCSLSSFVLPVYILHQTSILDVQGDNYDYKNHTSFVSEDDCCVENVYTYVLFKLCESVTIFDLFHSK